MSKLAPRSWRSCTPRVLSLGWGVLLALLCGCAQQTAAAPPAAKPAASAAAASPAPKALMARGEGDMPAVEQVEQHPIVPDVTMGPCVVEYQGRPLSQLQPVGGVAAELPKVNYAGFRRKRSIWVGHGSLTIAGFSANEEQVFALSEMETKLRVYDKKTGRLLAHNPLPDFPRFERGDFAVWPYAEPLHLVFANDYGLFLLDAATAQRKAQLGSLAAWGLEWSHDRSVLGAALAAIPEQISTLALYSLDHEPPTPELRFELILNCRERVDAWALNHKKDALLVNHYPSGDLVLYDLKSLTVTWAIPGPQYANSVDWHPDDQQVAVGGAEVWLLNANNPRAMSRYTKLGNNVHRVRYSPDGQVLAVSAYDGHARLLSTTPNW